MICKTKLSSMFGDINITNEFIQSIIGKPVKDKGKEIGVITIVDPDEDLLYVDIDERYQTQFEKLCSFEIIVRS